MIDQMHVINLQYYDKKQPSGAAPDFENILGILDNLQCH